MFQNMFALHMAGHTVGESYDIQQFIVDIVGQLLAQIAWIKINMQRIKFYCSVSFVILTNDDPNTAVLHIYKPV